MSEIEFLTAAQVADRLGVSIKTVARWANSGQLPTAVKAPGLRGARLFRATDIDTLTDRKDEK